MIFSGASRQDSSRRGSGGGGNSPHHHHHPQQHHASSQLAVQMMAVAGIRKDLDEAIRLSIQDSARRPSDICSARDSSPAPSAADIEAFGQQILADFRRRSKSVEARKLSELARHRVATKSGSLREMLRKGYTAGTTEGQGHVSNRRPSSAGRQSSIVSTGSSLSASLSPDANQANGAGDGRDPAAARNEARSSVSRKQSNWIAKLFGPSGTAPRRSKAQTTRRKMTKAQAVKRRAQSEIRRPVNVPEVAVQASSPDGKTKIVRSRSADDHLEPSGAAVTAGGGSTGDDHRRQYDGDADAAGGTLAGGDGLTAGRPTIRRNFNRFTNFVKTGAEAYVLSDIKPPLTPTQVAEIIDTDEGPRWRPAPHAYDCVVDKPKKEKKFKGMKSFIAYQLTPSFNGIQVSRRYKHFDWLHERLYEKFLFTPLPPLPEKQVAGKFEEEVIEQRKHILQLWVSKICRHPVLSQADVWMHFLTCTDDKKWKEGKRKAEKDEYCGGAFFLSVKTPERPIDVKAVEVAAERFSRGARFVDDGVRSVYHATKEMAKSMSVVHKRDSERVGSALDGLSLALSQAMELQTSPAPDDRDRQLTLAIKAMGGAFHNIGGACDEQARTNVEGLLAGLYMYKGMLAQIPEMLAVQKSAQSKRAECERLAGDNKVSNQELQSVRTRVDTISYVCQAEMAHFDRERAHDFHACMTKFLHGQIDFYKKVVQELESSLDEFKKIEP